IYKDNTFSLNGTLYEVPGILAGKNVKLRFDPLALSPVKIYSDGAFVADARIVDTYSNCKVVRDIYSKTITQAAPETSSDIKYNREDVRISSSLAAASVSGGAK
ncbi:MAG: Mu transposase C-terminal domain-containing protein, partial [Ignavibacteria bacterium]|nr:Mu transposase C-terminal domain-containing protein [Ignavibacteria bacterium]